MNQSPGTALSTAKTEGNAFWPTRSDFGVLARQLTPYSPDGTVQITPTSVGIALQAKEALSTAFLGSIHEDADKITVGANRDLGAGAGPTAFGDEYAFFDTITIGLDELTKFEPEDTTVIAATSFVYYRLTKAGAVITAALEHSPTRPVQIHGTLFVILGKAIVDSGAITTWTQYWFGDIDVWARFA